ncbi:MAG: hypothetical protein R6U66_10040 [Bacteroidales bacterium]|jgi:aspartate oxidase
MNAEQKELLTTLQTKVKHLMTLHNELLQENKHLHNKEKELKQQLQERDEEVLFLKNKYNKLKLAKSISASAGDSHEAKIKINRIVREIDKCVALLNR